MNIKRYGTGTGICAAILVCTLGRATHAADPNIPQGFVCGLSYMAGFPAGWPFHDVACAPYVDGYCELGNEGPAHTVEVTDTCGIITATTPGFFNFSDGDRGMPNGFGFYHQSWNKMNTTPSAMYKVPPGTACGFKESCNNSAKTCMGMDPNKDGCPLGWKRKSASDLNAPNGCVFVWCEYQDPNGQCTDQSCWTDSQPSGTVCGITDSRKNFDARNPEGGQCVGMAPTPANCQEIGYEFHGYIDAGSNGGNGVGYCMKP